MIINEFSKSGRVRHVRAALIRAGMPRKRAEIHAVKLAVPGIVKHCEGRHYFTGVEGESLALTFQRGNVQASLEWTTGKGGKRAKDPS